MYINSSPYDQNDFKIITFMPDMARKFNSWPHVVFTTSKWQHNLTWHFCTSSMIALQIAICCFLLSLVPKSNFDNGSRTSFLTEAQNYSGLNSNFNRVSEGLSHPIIFLHNASIAKVQLTFTKNPQSWDHALNLHEHATAHKHGSATRHNPIITNKHVATPKHRSVIQLSL